MSDSSKAVARMDRTNRRKYLGLVGSSVIAGLAGCGGENQDGNNTTNGGQTGTSSGKDFSGQSVKFLTEQGGDRVQQFWDEMGTILEEETGATLDIELGGLGVGPIQRVTQLLQANNPPEVVLTGNYGVTAQWAVQDLLAPVTELINTISDRIGDPPSQFLMQRDGEEVLVPGWSGYTSLWYRSDLAEELGLGSDFTPNTWEKFLQFAREADNNLDMAGTIVPANSTADATKAHLTTLLRTNEGQYTKYDSSNEQWVAAFGEGEHRSRMIETLEFSKELSQYAPSGGGTEYSQMINAIQTESAALNIYPGTRPKTQSIENNRPFARSVEGAIGPEKRSKNIRGQNSPFAVFKGSNVEAAKAFIEIVTRPENFARAHWLTTPIHNAPVYGGLVDSEEYQSLIEDDLSPDWTEDQIKFYLEEQREHAVANVYETEPVNPYFGTVTSSMIIPEMVSEVIVNDANPDSIIDGYAEELTSQLLSQQ